jgi:hypothetical protein
MNEKRELTHLDLGLEGRELLLRGTVHEDDDELVVRIAFIAGELREPFAVASSLRRLARRRGRSRVRIEATIANADLHDLLTRRYGLTTDGATDIFILWVTPRPEDSIP